MNESNYRAALIPLDERPVNTRYPRMIAEIAGVQLHLPPTEIMCNQRNPANTGALLEWARDIAPRVDALIVSCDHLGYGGLIPSRISMEPAGAIAQRLERLRQIRQQFPALTLHGFNVITRVSNANDAVEEPAYWQTYGARLCQLSQLIDRELQGEQAGVTVELAALRAQIPDAHTRDFLRRRVRNHTINLHALQLCAEGVFDLLVVSSDDTSPFGLPSREKRWLAECAGRLGIGDGPLLMYPGADEIGCALVALAINAAARYVPRFAARYAIPGGENNVAAYEDGPIRQTIERQVRAVGGVVTDESDAEFILFVNTPVERRSEWQPEYADREREERIAPLRAAVAAIAAQPSRAVICDVAYPNGADPVLIELLQQHVALDELAAYGAWNTAGNTIGTALAQACASHFAHSTEGRKAQRRFLAHRFIEDWGYQHVARNELRQALVRETDKREPAEENLAQTCAWIEGRLNELIAQLPGFAGRYRIQPGSARLPWKRAFEVDFIVEEEIGI